MKLGTILLLYVRVQMVSKAIFNMSHNYLLFITVIFKQTEYTVTEGVDEYVELIIQIKQEVNSKVIVVNVSVYSVRLSER